MTAPRCTVVVNTYHRPAALRLAMAALCRLTGVSYEIVVVRSPLDPETDEVLIPYRRRIKVVDCAQPNLSLARNVGIAAAAGDIVAFIDDDAIPTSTDWLARFATAFADDGGGKLAAVGGGVLQGDTEGFEFHAGATSEYGMQVFDEVAAGPRAWPDQEWIPRVPGGNCAFRRDALIAIGGFDAFFTYYMDETDVCCRLARAGWTIGHVPGNTVRHYPRRAGDVPFQRPWRVIARSDTYFSLKNGGDPLLTRLCKTLGLAPRKHYVRELVNATRTGTLPVHCLARHLAAWCCGVAAGCVAGLTSKRRTGTFAPPPPFIPCAEGGAERPLGIALLARRIPGQPGYGGVGRYTRDLALALCERGHKVHLVCEDETARRTVAPGFIVHGIPRTEAEALSPCPSVLDKNLAYSRAAVRKLAALHADGIALDVVHATNWDCEAAALIRAGIYPTVLMLVTPLAQVIASEGWEEDDDLRRSVEMDAWQIDNADAVCAPSNGVLDAYRSRMGLAPNSLAAVSVVPLGIVPSSVGTAPRSTRTHRLLFVGRLERRKGIHELLAALPGLLNEFPDWECDIVGQEPPGESASPVCEAFMGTHKAKHWLRRVRFRGSVTDDELTELYRACDLFVAPSLFESFGLIFHEAMQFGKPVVGTTAGGIQEVVEHSKEGLLVAPGDADALRKALCELMSDPGRRRAMGLAGALRIRERNNYRTMADRMERVYRATVARVGEERRRKRELAWPAPVTDQSGLSVERSDGWSRCIAPNGDTWECASPGAWLAFTAPASSFVCIDAARHSAAGTLLVSADGRAIDRIELYRRATVPTPARTVVRVPGSRSGKVRITLRAEDARNPASCGCDVWLRNVAAPGRPERMAS